MQSIIRRMGFWLPAVVAAVCAIPISAEELWTAHGGSTSLLLQPADLAAAGVTVIESDETAAAGDLQELSLGFEIEPGSTLLFSLDSQGVSDFLSGELRHSGSLGLSDNGTVRTLTCFIVLDTGDPNRLDLQILDGINGLPVFDVAAVTTTFDRAAGLLTVEGELLLNRDTIDAAGNSVRGTGVAVGRFLQVLRATSVFGRISDEAFDGRFVDTPLIADFAVITPEAEGAQGLQGLDRMTGTSGWFAPVLFDLLYPVDVPLLLPEPMLQPTDPRYPYAAIEAYRRHLQMESVAPGPSPEP